MGTNPQQGIQSGVGPTVELGELNLPNNSMLYTDNVGDGKSVPLGANNTFLKSTGVSSAPLFATIALTLLSDINIASPADGEVLTYDNVSSKWVNAAPAGGGSSFPLAIDTIIAPDNIKSIYGDATLGASIYHDGVDFIFNSQENGSTGNFKFLNGQALFPDGTASSPSITFAGSSGDEGIFFSGNTVAVSNSSALVFSFGFNFSGTKSGGTLMNEISSPTNPTLVMHPAFQLSGLGGDVNKPTLIASAFPNITVTKPASIATGSQDGNIFDVNDLTITGASTSFFEHKFMAADVTAATAQTITNAATVYISGAPAGVGSATITNPYALWVDSGNSRFDGDILARMGGLNDPSITFASDPNTGLSSLGDILVLIANGTAVGSIRTNGVFNVTGSASFGTGSLPTTSAVMDLVSTSKGFLPPRMTTIQRDAIGTPATGLTVYNTTTNVLNFYNGTSWGAV